MKIKIKNYGNKFSAKISSDSNIYEVACALRALLLATGYSLDSIMEVLPE